MKNQFAYIFSVALLLTSCLAEQNNELLVASCTDGIQNQNEEGIDCGGICFPCKVNVPVVAPCASALVENRVNFGGNLYLTDSDLSCTVEGDILEIFIYKNYTEIRIRIPYPITFSNIYSATQYYFPEGDEAMISMVDYNSDLKSSGGYIYVNVETDGSLRVEFCEVNMINQYGFGFYASGKIRCQ